MKIKISLLGPLKNPFNKKEFELEVNNDISIKKLLSDKFNYNESEMSFLVFILNDKQADINTELNNGDRLKVFLPLGGG